MRIAMLASGSNIHTVRWANALADRGLEIHLFSMHQFSSQLSGSVTQSSLRFAAPFGYLVNASEIRSRLNELSPDLLHTHYASGYGTLGRLSGFHPQILSVWGSDVFLFPKKSPIHRMLVKGNLANAEVVCSTGHVMARITRKICGDIKDLQVTSFGVDIEAFRPTQKRSDVDPIVVGTVKTLEWVYGIDVLIQAFAESRLRVALVDENASRRMRLLIAGVGSKLTALKQLAERCGVSAVTAFVGAIAHADVPTCLSGMDVFCALSRSESFGVAVLEASACGVPVVVSDVGGLPEVVVDGVTGRLVKSEDVVMAADAISQLVLNPLLRGTMGSAARRHVMENYDWRDSVAKLEDVYCNIVGKRRKMAA